MGARVPPPGGQPIVKLLDEAPGPVEDGGMGGTDLCRLLLEVHRALARALEDALAERGHPDLRAGHLAVFLNIDRRSGTRLTELARRGHTTKQAMMLTVDDLEARGYLRRVPDPTDGRAKVIRLTARGRKAAAEVRRALAHVEGRARRRLGGRRYEALRAALGALAGPGG